MSIKNTTINKLVLNSATFDHEVIQPNFINFLYGVNGKGKSTIAQTIASKQGMSFEPSKAFEDASVYVFDQKFVSKNFTKYKTNLDLMPKTIEVNIGMIKDKLREPSRVVSLDNVKTLWDEVNGIIERSKVTISRNNAIVTARKTKQNSRRCPLKMLTDILRFWFQYVLRFGLMNFLLATVAVTNIFTFFLFFLDKRKAIAGKRRISERVLILFAVFCGVGAAAAMRVFKHKTRKPKFAVAAMAGIVFTLIPVAHVVHGITLGRTVRFVEVPFYSENWPRELNGYRIAFMADIHKLSHEYMEKIIEELNGRGIDLLLLGGDFSTRDNHYLGSLERISRLETTDGIFGVEGNHDDHLRLFTAMKGFGMTPLDNSGLYVREGFFLAGVADKWNREPSIGTAINGAREDSFILLVSHNPDIARSQSTEGIDLVLSGHTHGGQITFFGYPFYLLRRSITHYGTRYAYGFTGTKDGAAMFVTSGVGVYYHIPRMFTRPEVVIFTMWNNSG